jgi:hypothetical protein
MSQLRGDFLWDVSSDTLAHLDNNINIFVEISDTLVLKNEGITLCQACQSDTN